MEGLTERLIKYGEAKERKAVAKEIAAEKKKRAKVEEEKAAVEKEKATALSILKIKGIPFSVVQEAYSDLTLDSWNNIVVCEKEACFNKE